MSQATIDEDFKSDVQDLVKALNRVEEKVDEAHDRIDDLQAQLEKESQKRERAGDATFERFESIEESLEKEIKTRSQQVAQVRARISTGFEKAGVEVADSEVMRDDKLMRLLRKGPADVVNHPTEKYERARKVLKKADIWGTVITDRKVPRVVFKSPEIRSRLNDVDDVKIQTNQVRRTFGVIEQLGQESPRRVMQNKTEKGVLVIEIQSVGDLLNAAQEVRE